MKTLLLVAGAGIAWYIMQGSTLASAGEASAGMEGDAQGGGIPQGWLNLFDFNSLARQIAQGRDLPPPRKPIPATTDANVDADAERRRIQQQIQAEERRRQEAIELEVEAERRRKQHAASMPSDPLFNFMNNQRQAQLAQNIDAENKWRTDPGAALATAQVQTAAAKAAADAEEADRRRIASAVAVDAEGPETEAARNKRIAARRGGGAQAVSATGAAVGSGILLIASSCKGGKCES